ncbi:MAG: hypothetical protein JO337_11080 [Acidimicrobiales bacterium]|nr:hypothetical protein [Acidimicrobiales bacterium]
MTGWPRRAAPLALMGSVLAGSVLVGACSTSTRSHVTSPPSRPAAGPVPGSSSNASSTTVAGQVPTVFNCGGGAYEPSTLIVVCGVGTTVVTGSKWTSWTATGAVGTGLVHLKVSGHDTAAPAGLALSTVVRTPGGPQFSSLTVTWTGASPDGQPSDAFRLAVADSK